MIRALVRPLAEVMGPFFSFVGVEGGKVRPRAAVVAGLVAALALLAILQGGPSASAHVPIGTTATLSQSPAGGAAIDPGPGNTITYTLFFFNTTDGFGGANAAFTAELTVDSNFFVTGLLCTGPAGVTPDTTPDTPVAGPAEVRCKWSDSDNDGLEIGMYTFTVTGYALPGGDNDVDPPSDVEVCHDTDGDADCNDEAAGELIPVTTAPTVGVLTINPNTVSPATATLLVGTPHTITWTLKDGYTCQGDTNDDDIVDCGSGDIVVVPMGTAAVLSGPTVGDADIGDETIVTVTIVSSNPGTVVVILNTRFEGDPAVDGDDTDPGQIGVDDVTATAIYTAAVGRLMGDVDCDGDVDAVDALKILRFVVGLPVSQTEPCPDIGTPQ
jgi:hypothetical protein